MSIQQPRRFVTTDQGHADVLNGPIDTLYANDQELAAQVENIKKDPAGNGVASKEALDNHASNTDFHVTAAKQAAWSAAEGNAKKYTDQYAASKQHSHLASDLPSASTQARGIVQLNTSTGSTSIDQAATPSAVKAANDRANEAYSRADQAFTQASDLKSKVANAITGKGGSANSGMTGDQLAEAISGLSTKKSASGNFNGQVSATSTNPLLSLAVSGLSFTPSIVLVNISISSSTSDYNGYISNLAGIRTYRGADASVSYSGVPGGFNLNISATVYISNNVKIQAYQWYAFE
ncbi:phage tail protein [Paenibacillus sp. FSL H8-0168]|uniref:phage tail protein n=1 Tax=Paenibacillus sp. FSL H8-0168 TaxID=2921378 RepID=UPI0031587E04